MPIVEPDGIAVIVHVHVHPGASVTRVAGRHGEALKLKVAAPPVDGKANEAVSTPSCSGRTLRSLRVEVEGVGLAAATAVIDAAIAAAGAASR
jgi:uncharacterized protein